MAGTPFEEPRVTGLKHLDSLHPITTIAEKIGTNPTECFGQDHMQTQPEIDFMITEKTFVSDAVSLRSAVPADVDALVYICRRCFPEHYRWQSIYPIGWNWWRVVVCSKASDTLVLEDSNGVFGYSVLVFDIALWRSESKHRDGSFIVRALSALLCPRPAVWRRLLKVAMMQLTHKRPFRNRRVQQNSDQTAWSETSAILPRMARRGYGSLLIEAREKKALHVGATIITTHVDSDNIASRRMNEHMGYKLISEDSRGCLYRKYLV